MDELNKSRAASHLWVIGVFLLCTFLMLLGWYVSSGYIETSEKINTNKTLTSIGRLKADQIQSYLTERRGDASAVARFLNNPPEQHWLTHQGGNAPAELNRLAESVVEAYQYRELLVLDANANILLGAGHGGILSETGKSIALRTMRERTPASYQIYFGDPSAPDVSVLDTFVPVMAADGTGSVGVVVVRSELNFLFNLIQTWPTESETAESLLVTKDGSDVLFLNELRHQKDTALKLRVPLSDDSNALAWPAISAATGHLGLFEANDYRGKHVLAYTVAVPDTPWSMVVKMDVAEATKRSHTLQKFTAMVLAIILGLAGMIVWIWWRKAETLHELQVMLETSGEGFWKVDQSGSIIEVNDAYCRLIGYARDEIVGAHISKFEAIEQTPEVVAEHVRHVVEQGYDRFETRHRHHDGHLIDIEVITSFIPETKCLIVFLHDVTERKRAQLVLRHSQDLLNETQQLANIGSWERNLMTGSFTCSEEIFRILEINFTHEDISYEAFILAIHPEDREMVDCAYMTCIQTREPFDIVHRLLFADGRVKWVNEHGNFYYDASGVPLRSIGAIQDITERKQAEEASRISAQKHQLLFESSRDALMTLAPPSWKFTGANQATLQLFGASSMAEFTALGPWNVSPERQPDGRSSSEKAQEMIAIAMRVGSCFFEWEHQRLDVQTFPADVLLTRMNVGEDVFLQASVRDISRRKRVEDMLRVAATAFETHEGIVITDAHANIIRVNRAFQNITGYSQEEVLGKNPRVRSSGRHGKAFYAEMWQQLLNNGSWIGEIWNKRKNGQIYPEWLTITAVKNGQGETTEYVAIFSDITERKEAEEKLRKYNEELEAINHQLQDTQNLLLQSDKMASIGQLAAGVAHEINNPIGYVSSNLGTLDEYLKELLDLVAVYEEMENVVADCAVLALVKAAKDKVDLGFLREDIPALMRETQEGIIRVRKIVQDLKDFSRADSGDEWHRTDLHKGLDSTLNVASNEIKYKADVRKDYGEIAEVECVISQLNQVFMNLLVNAAHAIENYGIITVRTGQQGEEVWVEIADTGKGIAPEHINKIFDPFFTTKPIGKGTGLGLSLSYGIIQKHHGRIEVNSEVGNGTSFKVWLPVSQPKDDNTDVGRVSFA